MIRPTKYDGRDYQLTSHAQSTARAAAFSQLPCFFSLLRPQGRRP